LSSGDRFVNAALSSAKVPDLLARGSRAVLNGLWLGVLSDARLSALDEEYYRREPMYRTTEWNERGLFDWEREQIREFFPEGCRVIVVACGGGREVLALLNDGYDATGYESHPALAEFGRSFLASHGHPSRIAAVARDSFPTDVQPYEAAILGWGALSLVAGSGRRESLLSGARACLEPGAPFLVSFFERRRDHREARWTTTIANAVRGVRGTTKVELGDTLAPNLVHFFDADEIRALATRSGFDVCIQRRIASIDVTTAYALAVLRAR